MRDAKWRWRQELPPATTGDRSEVAELTSHVLLLLHAVAPYGGLMSDLDWYRTFALPYWDFINPVGLQDENEQKFLGDGCLLLTLTRVDAYLDGQGGTIDLGEVSSALAGIVERDEPSQRLHRLVQDGVRAAAQGEGRLPPDNGRWVFDTFVAGYFRRVAQALGTGA